MKTKEYGTSLGGETNSLNAPAGVNFKNNPLGAAFASRVARGYRFVLDLSTKPEEVLPTIQRSQANSTMPMPVALHCNRLVDALCDAAAAVILRADDFAAYPNGLFQLKRAIDFAADYMGGGIPLVLAADEHGPGHRLALQLCSESGCSGIMARPESAIFPASRYFGRRDRGYVAALCEQLPDGSYANFTNASEIAATLSANPNAAFGTMALAVTADDDPRLREIAAAAGNIPILVFGADPDCIPAVDAALCRPLGHHAFAFACRDLCDIYFDEDPVAKFKARIRELGLAPSGLGLVGAP